MRTTIVCAICLIKLLLLPLYHETIKYDAKGNNPRITIRFTATYSQQMSSIWKK